MARPRAPMFQREPLEGKQLLSTTHVTHHTATQAPPLVLDGDFKNPTDNVVYYSNMSQSVEKFSGHVKGMGTLTGSMNNFLPYTAPLDDPEIVLTSAKGSVTLVFGQNDLISQSDIVTQVMTRVRFTVQSGTGTYAGASGAGVFTQTINSGNIHTAGWVTPTVGLKLHTTRSG